MHYSCLSRDLGKCLFDLDQSLEKYSDLFALINLCTSTQRLGEQRPSCSWPSDIAGGNCGEGNYI